MPVKGVRWTTVVSPDDPKIRHSISSISMSFPFSLLLNLCAWPVRETELTCPFYHPLQALDFPKAAKPKVPVIASSITRVSRDLDSSAEIVKWSLMGPISCRRFNSSSSDVTASSIYQSRLESWRWMALYANSLNIAPGFLHMATSTGSNGFLSELPCYTHWVGALIDRVIPYILNFFHVRPFSWHYGSSLQSKCTMHHGSGLCRTALCLFSGALINMMEIWCNHLMGCAQRQDS